MTTPGRSAPLRLGALEQQVMDTLWDEGESSIREVINHLGAGSAYTTIATVMSNLARKKLVRPRREGRSVRYHPTHSRDEYAARLMGQALDSSGDRTASIRHFVDTIPPDDLQMLREYLDGLEDSR